MRNEKRKALLSLSILLVFFLSSLALSEFSFAATQEQDITVEWGDNIPQNLPYIYSGTFYESTDHKFAYSSAKIQFQYVDDTSLDYEYTITDSLENSETSVIWDETNATTNNGTISDFDNLKENDDSYGFSNSTNPLGNYPATYSFTEEAVGTNGTDIEFVDSATLYDGACEIVSDWQGHRKVLRLQDDATPGEDPYFIHTENQATAGTREFWVGSNDINENEGLYFKEGGNNKILLSISAGNLNYYIGGAGWTVAQTVSNNTWYHIKIEWYATNTYDLYVDNVLIDSGVAMLAVQVSGINFLQIICAGDSEDYLYLDAYGDPDNDAGYNIGDNLNDNYFLGTETFENYNQTTTGDYYGSESFDYNTEEGVYYGTYDFRDDTVGGNPAGWSVDEEGGTVNVITEKDGHKKVLEFYDDDPVNGVSAIDTFPIQTNGTIEFWWGYNATETLQHYAIIDFKESATVIFRLLLNYKWGELGAIAHFNGSEYIDVDGTSYPINIMRHIKLIFNDYSNHAEIFVNGISKGNFDYWHDSTVGIDTMHIWSRIAHMGGPFTHWFDAIGYSWDTTSHDGLGYTVGYNINDYDIEPLLEDFTNEITYDTSVSVVNELDGHNNVLNITDDSTEQIIVIDTFSGQASGSVEFWLRINSTTQNFRWVIGDDGYYDGVYIGVVGGNFKYYDGVWNDYSTPITPVVDTWYHVRIDFECGGGAYEGLAVDDFHLYWNGVKYSDNDMRGNPTEMDEFRTYINNEAEFGKTYLDALGYSWDSDYDVGDNINSHGKEVITALENEGWTVDNNVFVDVGISGEFNSHKKFLNITDNSATSGGLIYDSISSQTLGIIEFYFKTDDVTKRSSIRGYGESVQHSLYLYIDGGNLNAYDGGSDVVQAIVNNVWYHISIDFDCETDTYDIYVDSILKISDYDFYFVADTIDQIRFCIGIGADTDTDYSVYFDAIHYSWEDTNTYFKGSYNQHCNVEPVIDYIVDLPFENYDKTMLIANISSFHFTNTYTYVSLNLYNFTSNSWLEINNSINLVESQRTWYKYQHISGLFSSSAMMRLRYYAYNNSESFYLKKDQLNCTVFFATELNYEKTLRMLGTWKYRFKLDEGLGTEYIHDWIYFNVIEQTANWEGISESRYSTEWVLTSTATTGTLSSVYSDDMTSGYWDLSDYSSRYFTRGVSSSYLFDNSTITDGYIYEGVHWDVGAQTDKPYGFVWDGTNFWVLDYYDDAEVYKYTSDGVYTGISWDTSGEVMLGVGLEWDGTNFYVVCTNTDEVYKYTSDGVYTGVHWDVGAQSIYPRDIVWDGTFFYILTISDNVYKYTSAGVYTGTSWDVSSESTSMASITWDGTNFWILDYNVNNKVYKYTSAGVYTGTTFDLTTTDDCYGIVWDGNSFYIVSISTDEVYEYEVEYDIFKNYHTNAGEGSAYMQTDSTETIGLKSQQYSSDYSLSAGDIFTIDLQTTSSNAQLKLYDDDVLQDTLNILIANTETGRQEVEVYVSEDVTYDQVKITSELDDTEYFQLYDIKAEHWTFTDSDDQDIMHVEPFGQNSQIINNLGSCSLKIYENDILTIDTYITITYDLTTYIYESPLPETIFVSLYDSDNEYVDFNEFKVYVNYTLGETTHTTQRLTSREFYVDEESTIYFNIYDSFDIEVYSSSRLASTFIDITLSVYTLKIKNEALDDSSYTLTKGSVSKTGILFPDEIKEYQIASGSYTFAYIKGSDPEVSGSFSLSDDRLLKINRSQMCFLSYADQQGNHLSFDNYKTYINGSMIYQQIFYEDAGDDVNITITDRYDYEVYQDVYSVDSGDNYIPITLTMYSLKVMNQQEAFNHINITRDPNYYESPNYWSEWIAPNEIIEFTLFAGYYKINLTDAENSGSSEYGYELAGDDILLLSSDNTIYNVLYNLANVNTTIGNQITYICVNLTNQNSQINNSIVFLTVNIESMNSSLESLLVNFDFGITNIANNISSLYVFTNNSFINLDNAMNTSFIYMENNIISINQSISTLVLGIDNQISILNGTVTTMFTEMNQQFIVTQTSIDFSFTSLNQSIIQLANNISTNHVILYDLIEQRANDIDENIINIQTLINLLNSTVANESLVVQTLVNLIGNNITENHVIINNLINLLGNNITENNLQLVSILELIGNNITSNHFVLQTLIDVIGNNITSNHFELLTNLNLINSTIGVNQIELINSILLINSTISDLVLELTNQILFVNDTIYTAVLDLSTSVEFGVDVILGNLTLTYQQNEFLTELYKETMFSQLLNWSDVAYNYTLMEDRIDVWDFINNYNDQSITVFLQYNDLIDNLTVSAQNTIEQYLPADDVEYRLWSITDEEYLTEWQELPANRTVDFGFYDETIPVDPDWYAPNIILMVVLIIMGCGAVIGLVGYIAHKYRKKNENYQRSYADRVSFESNKLKNFSQGNRIR